MLNKKLLKNGHHRKNYCTPEQGVCGDSLLGNPRCARSPVGTRENILQESRQYGDLANSYRHPDHIGLENMELTKLANATLQNSGGLFFVLGKYL